MREIRPSGSEGGVALTASSLPLSSVGWPVRLAELQFVEPFFHFIEAQEDAAVLAQQLPAEPSADSEEAP
jgi:hypothetical protein